MWGCASASVLQELTVLQKRALRIICKSSYLSHSSPIFKELSILKLSDLNLYCTTLFVYKCKHNFLPHVCTHYLTVNDFMRDLTFKLRAVSEFVIPFS